MLKHYNLSYLYDFQFILHAKSARTTYIYVKLKIVVNFSD